MGRGLATAWAPCSICPALASPPANTKASAIRYMHVDKGHKILGMRLAFVMISADHLRTVLKLGCTVLSWQIHKVVRYLQKYTRDECQGCQQSIKQDKFKPFELNNCLNILKQKMDTL